LRSDDCSPWAEKPIDSLATIAGPWSGTGSHARGAEYTIKYWFIELYLNRNSPAVTAGQLKG